MENPDGITRNQIDYITVNRRYRNTVRDIRTHPEADRNSDYNMLVGNVRMKCAENLVKVSETR